MVLHYLTYKLKLIQMLMQKMFKSLILICAALTVSITVMAQQNVKGVVTDDTGEPLPGVTVIEFGTTRGIVTDIDGAYSIQVSPEASLQFSFIGMVSQTIEVKNKTTIDVKLKPDAIGLEEVVVIGYGEKKKITVTGAVSTISHDELVKSPSASIGNSLAGKITGISSVQTSGMPGGDEAQLFIRGVGTLNDASPLTIVDGVERPFTQIDPEEIESISILKDASATAVYGVRGANGVIIVTTKRGEVGKTKISVTTSFGVQQPTKIIEKANSYIYGMGHNERALNDGNGEDNLVFSPEMLDVFKNGGSLIYPDIDWFDYVMKPLAAQSKHNITISGGTEKVRYFISLGYFSQDGQFKNFDRLYDGNFGYDRYNYRTNLDIDVTKSSLLKVSIGGRAEIRNRPRAKNEGLFKQANWAQPFAGAGIVDGKWISSSQDYIGIEMKDALTGYYGMGFDNATKNFLDFDIDFIQKLNFITKGLEFKVKASYNTNYTHTIYRGSSAARYEPMLLTDDNGDNILDENGEPTIGLRKISDEGNLAYDYGTGKARNWYAESSLSYNRTFGDHDVSGLVLYNQRVLHYPKFNNNNMSDFDIPRTTLGLVGRLTYNYKTKYLFDINIGYNGSENFPEDKRFGFFPALSAGWIITEEPFMQDIGFIDYFKIRASYGEVGNDKLQGNRFLYLPDTWNPNQTGYNFGIGSSQNQPGAIENKLGNPNVTWERAVKKNIGINAKFFGAKLGIEFDYFHDRRDDILITRNTIPSYVAANLPAVNMGIVENSGYEAQISWDQKFSDFSYYIRANASFARNERIFWDEIPQQWDYLYRTGTPIGQRFGRVFDGFFEETMETNPNITHPDQGPVYPGDVRYVDLNNDGVINDFDEKAMGYPDTPEYTFGLNMGFRYKNFDLSSTWTGAANTSRLLVAYFREPFGGQNRALMQYMYDDRWTPEAENPLYPRFSVNSGTNNYSDSDLWLKDASYIRLKNVEIGYTFKSSFLKRIGLQNVRAFVNGLNLLTFDKLEILDPEAKPRSAGDYPIIKVYNTGLKFNF
jgi:TonB-linked SusC/RagA family outer membrane protein